MHFVPTLTPFEIEFRFKLNSSVLQQMCKHLSYPDYSGFTDHSALVNFIGPSTLIKFRLTAIIHSIML